MSSNRDQRPVASGGSSASSASSASSGSVLRLVLSPRWIAWHLLTLGAMVSCGFLAAWQWHRAGSAMGSAVNVGYGLQWPAFALFFAWIWWRMLRIELAKVREAASVPEPVPAVEPRASLPRGPSPFVHRHGGVPTASDDDDPELAEYNRMLAALAEHDRQSTN